MWIPFYHPKPKPTLQESAVNLDSLRDDLSHLEDGAKVRIDIRDHPIFYPMKLNSLSAGRASEIIRELLEPYIDVGITEDTHFVYENRVRRHVHSVNFYDEDDIEARKPLVSFDVHYAEPRTKAA